MIKKEIVDEIHKLAPNMTAGSAKALMGLRKDDLKILLKRLDASRIEMVRGSRRLEVEDWNGVDIVHLADENPICAMCEHGPHSDCSYPGIPYADEGFVCCSGFSVKTGENEEGETEKKKDLDSKPSSQKDIGHFAKVTEGIEE